MVLNQHHKKIKIEATEHTGLMKKQNKLLFCPFAMVGRFLAARGNYETDDEPCFVFKDKSHVKPEHIRKLLKQILKKLNLNPELYNTHSMRAGRATDLMFFNYSITEIKRAGRWRSTSALMKYLKP